jgi:ABC-type nickel/cobalt efflux system permease component RcnA
VCVCVCVCVCAVRAGAKEGRVEECADSAGVGVGVCVGVCVGVGDVRPMTNEIEYLRDPVASHWLSSCVLPAPHTHTHTHTYTHTHAHTHTHKRRGLLLRSLMCVCAWFGGWVGVDGWVGGRV